MSLALRIYHHLPPAAGSLAATLRGAYLRWWRYGPETDRLVEEALERERWSPERWRTWREERLAFVLDRAATRVPFYRAHWAARRAAGDRAAWDRLEHWPILEKETLRAHPRAFVADDHDVRRMFREHTSGTTGTALTLWWSRATVRAWYALFEARWRRWHGVSRADRWAIFGGQLVVPVARRRPPVWVWNAALHQLYVSTYHLSAELIDASLAALERHRVRYLLGYPSALAAVAARAVERGETVPGLVVALGNAEPLLADQRRIIERGFGCPARETYGMAEAVAAGGECSAGRMHAWPEVGWLEYGGGAGDELIGTGLLNADMPLIRYRVGDRATPPDPAAAACACGRTLPALGAIDGRNDDVLVTADGRLVGRLDPVFKGDLPVREAQIVQETLDRVRLRYVPTAGFGPHAAHELTERLHARLGPVEVVLDPVAAIPRTSAGKFRAVVSLLSPEERTAALAKR